MIYSVAKYDDFGINLREGPIVETGLGQAFAAAMAGSADTLHLVDFAPYAPAGGEASAFLARPVELPIDAGGQEGIDGLVIYRFTGDIFNRFMASGNGARGDRRELCDRRRWRPALDAPAGRRADHADPARASRRRGRRRRRLHLCG